MGAGLVMLREGFEASLIVGILLAFLNRTGRRDGFAAVWAGAGIAAAISVGVGALLFAVGAELEGTAEAAFEGGAMLLAAGLLTWMIFWMRTQSRGLKRELETQVEHALATGSAFALGLVAFISVLREGIETALFLFGTVEGSNRLVASTGAVVGLAAAIGLGYLFYRGSSRLDLRRFFTFTSVLLLVFAGWLLARGLEELAEGGIMPENEGILVGAFLLLAVPTVYRFLRGPRSARRAAVSETA
ncbi:MAG TPA: FTR1 family protein [Gaiellaceae bacterium]|jgi:high-affinity iron transporter|nr:FTR1 family protein [Gaiellaceae bacterium]